MEVCQTGDFQFSFDKNYAFEKIEQCDWSFVKSKVLNSNMKRLNSVFRGIIIRSHKIVYFANRKYCNG